MTHIEIFLLALALAADAFSVGLATGLTHKHIRQVFRLSFHFGLFQALFPLVGALTGTMFLKYIEVIDHWVAFGLLLAIGLNMIKESRENDDEVEQKNKDLTRGFSLIYLSTAVSIDAFAAGISMAATNVNIWYAVTVIGVVAALATAFAMKMANNLGKQFGSRCELVGGIILILLGSKILYEHLV